MFNKIFYTIMYMSNNLRLKVNYENKKNLNQEGGALIAAPLAGALQAAAPAALAQFNQLAQPTGQTAAAQNAMALVRADPTGINRPIPEIPAPGANGVALIAGPHNQVSTGNYVDIYNPTAPLGLPAPTAPLGLPAPTAPLGLPAPAGPAPGAPAALGAGAAAALGALVARRKARRASSTSSPSSPSSPKSNGVDIWLQTRQKRSDDVSNFIDNLPFRKNKLQTQSGGANVNNAFIMMEDVIHNDTPAKIVGINANNTYNIMYKSGLAALNVPGSALIKVALAGSDLIRAGAAASIIDRITGVFTSKPHASPTSVSSKTSESRNHASESRNHASESRNHASESKNPASESKNLFLQSRPSRDESNSSLSFLQPRSTKYNGGK